MQPAEWMGERVDDDDIGPILRAREQDVRPGCVGISDQSRELKILLAQWDSLRTDQGTRYGDLRKVKRNICKLWCQNPVSLEYRTQPYLFKIFRTLPKIIFKLLRS